MSEIQFSKEQLEAIETQNSSILISAAAGSGKTAVLVERIIRLICDYKIDVDKLLVVTFTNAAAQGMREKIKKELTRRMKKEPDNLHLRRQSILLNVSNISTVHAFCGNLLKKYNHLIQENIPVNYTLLEETERELIMQEVLNEVLDSYYDKEDEVFERCIESYGSGSLDDQFIKILMSLYSYIISIPFYKDWAKTILNQLKSADSFYDSIYGKTLFSHIKELLKSAIDKYEFALDYIAEDEGLLPYADTFFIEKDYFNRAKNADNLKESLALLKQVTFERLRPAKRGTNTFVPVSIRNVVKNEVKKINSTYTEEIILSSEETGAGIDIIEKIFEILLDFDQQFKAKKYEKNNLDFNDLEHLTIEILCGGNQNGKSEVAKELSENFHEILVDEYQDTNDVQETIFKLISKDNNLFVVGDVKQSIYRFRHANPNLFINRLNSYKNQNSKDHKVLFLNANYRCQENIIQTVNHIFSYIMTEQTSKIDYLNNDRLILGGTFLQDTENKLHSEVLIALRNEDCEEDTLETAEAAMIADRIKELIRDKDLFIPDGDQKRPVTYSDITILVRNFNEKTLLFLSELTSLGIPAIYDDKTNFFETVEIKIMNSMLKVIDNPYDDISLISVLRNVFDLSDEALLEIRMSLPKGHFYDAVQSKSQVEEPLRKILQYIEELREFATKYELHTLIKKIYDDTFFMEKQLSIIDGIKRKENLNQLLEIAKHYEGTGFKGIASFIGYIGKVIASERKLAKLSSNNQENNSVKIMTIHKSKGLEFPIVFMAGMHKQFNLRDLSNPIILNSDLGIGFDFVDLELRCKYPTIYKKVVCIEEQKEQLTEEIRVLYVGLTRAKHKLILTGALKGKDNDFEKYAKTMLNSSACLSYLDFLNVKSYFDLILPSLFHHKNFSAFRNEYLDDSFIKPMDFEVDCKLYKNSDLTDSKEKEFNHIQLIKEKLKEELHEDKQAEIEKLVNFHYEQPYFNIPQKISVSELKGIYLNENTDYGKTISISTYVPEFSELKKLTAAEKGTLIHYVFENVDLKTMRDPKNISSVLKEFYENTPYLTKHLTLKDLEKAELYFKSELGLKMLAAKEVHREKDFLITLPVHEVYKEFASVKEEEKIIIQGIIDLYFVDTNNNIYLVDYKYTSKSMEMIQKEYQYQINLYKLALSKILEREQDSIIAYIWDVNKGIFVQM